MKIKQTERVQYVENKKMKSPDWNTSGCCDESKSHRSTEDKRGAGDEGASEGDPRCSEGMGTRLGVASGSAPHSCDLPCASRSGREAGRRRRWRRVTCRGVPQGCWVPAGNVLRAFGSWRTHWPVPGLQRPRQRTVADGWNKILIFDKKG